MADDAIGSELVDGAFVAHHCYSTVRFDDALLQRLPALAAHSRAPMAYGDWGKHLAPITAVLGRRPAASASIEAVVLPVVVGTGPTRLTPTTKAVALRGLAPSTLLRGLGPGARGLAHMAELVRQTPCYELRLGATVDDVPAVVAGLLADGSP